MCKSPRFQTEEKLMKDAICAAPVDTRQSFSKQKLRKQYLDEDDRESLFALAEQYHEDFPLAEELEEVLGGGDEDFDTNPLEEGELQQRSPPSIDEMQSPATNFAALEGEVLSTFLFLLWSIF